MRLGENYHAYPQPEPNPLQRFGRVLQVAAQVFTPGDDLSHWNTVNNWFLKQAEMKFSVLKLGEGGDPNPDANLWQFAAEAKASNTQVMVYWFFRSNFTGEVQAEYCLNLANQLAAFLGYKPRLWADVETTDGQANSTRIARLGKFLELTDAWNPGKPTGIYTSPGFANLNLTPTPAYVNTHPQWIAHWTSAALPTQPTGWNAAQRIIWQIGYWDGFSWCPPVPGCVPDVDRNKFFGDETQLTAFTGYTVPPPPTEEYVTRAEFDAALANLMLLIRPPMTHTVNTTDLNGEKLRNNPDSGEHVMLKHGTEVRRLSSIKWKGMYMYGLIINGYPVFGYLEDSEVLPK